ncbi:hypothetical protein HanRHA438_Chr12g0559971 [Helianthus annuus]|nr:hypothetical protein HanHA89_Chr12g0474971 [Helianthus annuus]KAJ0867160.1 hypothetical protein HanRHA438_Chr12g0559971 [Helianthus annuus]
MMPEIPMKIMINMFSKLRVMKKQGVKGQMAWGNSADASLTMNHKEDTFCTIIMKWSLKSEERGPVQLGFN